MGLYFQKSLKRATALALIFAVSAPVSASHVTWTSKSHINDNDSFESIATGTMDLSIRPFGIDRDMEFDNQLQASETIRYLPAVEAAKENIQQVKRSVESIATGTMDLSIRPFGIDRDMEFDNQLQASETIRYLPAVEAAKENIQQVKRSVVDSNLLTYPQSQAAHKGAFENLITQVYGNTSLGRCPGDQSSPYRNQIEEISDKLFKVSQKHLANSKDRDEWINAEADLGSGGFFTFTLNNDLNNSIYVNDLNIALPLYGEHRQSNVNSLTPRGSNLTADERITAQFLNRIQSGEIPGNPFKQAIKYRRANKSMSLENLTRHMKGEDLPLVPYQPPKQHEKAAYFVTNALFLLNADLKNFKDMGAEYLSIRQDESLADYFVRCVYGFGYVSKKKRNENPNAIFQDITPHISSLSKVNDKQKYAEYYVANGLFLLNSDIKDQKAREELGKPYATMLPKERFEDYFIRVLYGMGYLSKQKRKQPVGDIFKNMSGKFTESGL